MRALLAIVLVSVAAACGGDGGPTALDDAFVGSYALTSINGSPLPYTLYDLDDELVRVESGKLVLNADGHFLDIGTVTVRTGGVTTTEPDTISGTYTRTGNRFDFTSTDVESYSMTWNGSSQMTQSEEGFVLVYTR